MITFASIVQSSSTEWTWTWTGTGPYLIELDGDVIEESTTVETYTRYGDDAEEPPALEVTDLGVQTVDSENTRHNPRAVLQWRGNRDVDHYNIEQYVDAAWTQVNQLIEDDLGYYRYETYVLDDVTAHQFRVIAVDAQDVESIPLQFTFTMVRNPDVPSITATYDDGTGLLTIAAR